MQERDCAPLMQAAATCDACFGMARRGYPLSALPACGRSALLLCPCLPKQVIPTGAGAPRDGRCAGAGSPGGWRAVAQREDLLAGVRETNRQLGETNYDLTTEVEDLQNTSQQLQVRAQEVQR